MQHISSGMNRDVLGRIVLGSITPCPYCGCRPKTYDEAFKEALKGLKENMSDQEAHEEALELAKAEMSYSLSMGSFNAGLSQKAIWYTPPRKCCPKAQALFDPNRQNSKPVYEDKNPRVTLTDIQAAWLLINAKFNRHKDPLEPALADIYFESLKHVSKKDLVAAVKKFILSDQYHDKAINFIIQATTKSATTYQKTNKTQGV